MLNDEIAAAVLECVGGVRNVTDNSLCATRLRISVNDPSKVERNALHSIKGVLGVVDRGSNGLEVVFGPNLVKGVYQAFENLTGIGLAIAPGIDEDVSNPPVRSAGNFQVRITPEVPGRPQSDGTPAAPSVVSIPVAMEDETSTLLELLQDDGVDADAPAEEAQGMRLLVVNGPGLNMLGICDPDRYGPDDFATLLELCHSSAEEAGFAACECYQSNHEGDLIDCIQDAYGLYDGIVINPAAYAHTSVALLDALLCVGLPAVEVHIPDISLCEGIRSVSYVSEGCIETVMGMGIEGYRKAIFDLARHLGIQA